MAAEVRKKRTMPSWSGVGDEALVVVRHGGNHAGGAVGGRGNHAAAGGVLFVHRHGVDGNPVERRQRIAAQAVGLLRMQALGQTMRAAAHVQAAGQNSFGRHAALHAVPHGLPDAVDAFAHQFDRRALGIVRHERALVLKHQLADGELVGVRGGQQLRRAVKRERNRVWPFVGSGGPLSVPSSTMNPPPMEKKVRWSSCAPAASKAVSRSPLGCCIARRAET